MQIIYMCCFLSISLQHAFRNLGICKVVLLPAEESSRVRVRVRVHVQKNGIMMFRSSWLCLAILCLPRMLIYLLSIHNWYQPIS